MNIKDIAKLANVSVSTVSKVMNKKDSSIGRETRERVLQIAKEYNYSPYASIVSSSAKTFQLGVLFRSMDTAHMTLCGILSQARALGYNVTVADSNEDVEEELKNITMFCKTRVDALLWEPVFGTTTQSESQLKTAEIPFVVFNSHGANAYNIDYAKIGYTAVQTLVDNGHRDIACILPEEHRMTGFYEGYKKCLFDNLIPFSDELVFHEINAALIYKISNQSVSGIVCSHFSSALELYGHCSDLHYKIPEYFSVVSAKDDASLGISYPRISTYSIPYYRFGSFLCQQVVRSIESPESPAEDFVTDVILDNTDTIDAPRRHREPKITVVGSINIDNYLNVAQLPSSGVSVRTSSSFQYPGGKGTNEAIGAAKLGHHVAILGNVGNDMDSNLIYDALNKASVDSSGLSRCSNLLTGKAYIMVEAGGDSLVSILPGANDFLRPEDIRARENIFKNTGYALINTEIPIDTVAEACLSVHKYGGKTIVKPAACNHIPEEVLENIDILIPNQSEINNLVPDRFTLCGKANYFLQHGVKVVIVTRGADGCFLKTPNYEKFFPAMDFVSIDNTGAGDAFIAAFASYMLYGYDLESSIRIAGYAAGFSITREGVVPSLIDKNTLESYILEHEPQLLLQKAKQS